MLCACVCLHTYMGEFLSIHSIWIATWKLHCRMDCIPYPSSGLYKFYSELIRWIKLNAQIITDLRLTQPWMCLICIRSLPAELTTNNPNSPYVRPKLKLCTFSLGADNDFSPRDICFLIAYPAEMHNFEPIDWLIYAFPNSKILAWRVNRTLLDYFKINICMMWICYYERESITSENVFLNEIIS